LAASNRKKKLLL